MRGEGRLLQLVREQLLAVRCAGDKSMELSCVYCYGEGRTKILLPDPTNGMYQQGGYKHCYHCNGTGRIRSSGYVPLRSDDDSDDEPVARRPIVIDLDNFGFNPCGAFSVMVAAVLMAAVAFGAYYVYETYLVRVEQRELGRYIWITGAVVFGVGLLWLGIKLCIAVLRKILGSIVWLTILAGVMAWYEHALNHLGWWPAIWKSVVLFGVIGLLWEQVYRSRIGVIVTCVAGAFLWNWLFNGRFVFW